MIQSESQWVPNVAHNGFKQKSTDEVFALLPITKSKNRTGFEFFGANGFTASDAIDIVNPLQHLPIIGPLYREFTDDSLDPFSRIAGNTLFFGPFGAAFSFINMAVEGVTGKDIGSSIISMLKYKNTDTSKIQTTNTTSIKPSTSVAKKNNPIDPVLAWATNEINYRNRQALRQGIDLPDRTYSTLVASATSKSNHLNQTTVVSTQHKSEAQVQKPRMLIQQETLALKELKNNRIKPPANLQQIKRTTRAYSPLVAFIKKPYAEQPIKHIEPGIHLSKTKQTQLLVSAPIKKGWFSSSLNDALSKYHQAKSLQLFSAKGGVSISSALR